MKTPKEADAMVWSIREEGLQISPLLAATGGGHAVLVLNDDGTWAGDPFEAARMIRADEREKIATWLETHVPSTDHFAQLFDRLAAGIRNGEHNEE